MSKPIEIEQVKKRTNRVRLEEFFGEPVAEKIIACLDECVGAENFDQCVIECLKNKGVDATEAGKAVTIMGFITVG